MSIFPLHLSEDLKEAAAAQAEAAGVSLNQYIATALAARVRAQSDTVRYFVTRAAKAKPGRAREVLGRSGIGHSPRSDGILEGDEGSR